MFKVKGKGLQQTWPHSALRKDVFPAPDGPMIAISCMQAQPCAHADMRVSIHKCVLAHLRVLKLASDALKHPVIFLAIFAAALLELQLNLLEAHSNG